MLKPLTCVDFHNTWGTLTVNPHKLGSHVGVDRYYRP